MIARHLDAGNQIFDLMSIARLPHDLRHDLEIRASVFDSDWFDENLAKEVTHHPLGSIFCTINGNHSKMFRPNLLHSRLDDARWLSKYGLSQFSVCGLCAATGGFAFCSHS